MAPELLVNELRPKEASIADLLKADVWAFGMVIFNVINPGLQHPYEINIEKCTTETSLDILQEFLKNDEKPIFQSKYESFHQGEWAGLKRIYQTCTAIESSSRPLMVEVIKMICREKQTTRNTSLSQEGSLAEIHLKVSQTTAVENVDRELQKTHDGNYEQSTCYTNLEIPDDATNACAFLAILIAHELRELENMSWRCVADTAESIIVTYPHVFNRFRDVSRHYDVMEAYSLLKNHNCLPGNCYGLTEELPYADDALSDIGKTQLLEAMTLLASKCPSFGFYTCDSFIFLVGSYNSQMFVLDTHAIPAANDEKSCSLLKTFTGVPGKAAEECCRWLWERLSGSNLNGPQSLSRMVVEDLERFVNCYCSIIR